MKHIQDGSTNMADTCVAIGFFDGLHIGHQVVIDQLVQTAGDKGLKPVLVSLYRDIGDGEKILTSEDEKAYLLREAPLEALVSVKLPAGPLDDALLAGTLSKLGAKAVVTGENCGKLEALRNWASANGAAFVTCGVVADGGAPVSSDAVADALAAGDLDTVDRLLGRPYMVVGKVVKGKQLGRTVGQPTANIDFPQNKLLPPDGSYATVTMLDGKRWVGLTNIGKRPTVDNFDYATVENHILDFSGDLYGQVLPLEIRRFVRGVQKFNNLQEVTVQVAKDLEKIRGYLDTL